MICSQFSLSSHFYIKLNNHYALQKELWLTYISVCRAFIQYFRRSFTTSLIFQFDTILHSLKVSNSTI